MTFGRNRARPIPFNRSATSATATISNAAIFTLLPKNKIGNESNRTTVRNLYAATRYHIALVMSFNWYET